MNIRKFTRYATDMPINLQIEGMPGEHQHYLKDASQGGLCIKARGCLKLGTHLDISIPVAAQADKIGGTIGWCRPSDNGMCLLGIAFEQQVSQSAIEKLEQFH